MVAVHTIVQVKSRSHTYTHQKSERCIHLYIHNDIMILHNKKEIMISSESINHNKGTLECVQIVSPFTVGYHMEVETESHSMVSCMSKTFYL